MLYFALDHINIAEQIAALINTYNKLEASRSIHDILHGPVNYVVENHGRWLIGAVGLHRQSYTFTEIKHLVVQPDWRGKGLAKFLLGRATSLIDTKMMYATVRENNLSSLHLFESLGFKKSGTYDTDGHSVILLVKVNPKWQKKKSVFMSGSSSVTNLKVPTIPSLRQMSQEPGGQQTIVPEVETEVGG